MNNKTDHNTVPPIETSRLSFITGFWPLLLVFAVGPVGDIIMGNEFVPSPVYPAAVAASLLLCIILFVAAGLWAYRPMVRIMNRTDPYAPIKLETVVYELPYRLGKAFLFSGVLFATIGLLVFIMSYTGATADRPPVIFVIGSALTNYYAFGLVTTVLGVASTLNFTTRLKKSLSTKNIFTSNLQSAPYYTSKCSSSMISVTKRPWQLFIITSVLPFLLIAILFMISRDIAEPIHKRAAYTAMVQIFLGVLVCGTYLVYTMRNSMKLAIDELQYGMDSIKNGQYSNRVAVLLDDETGNMARSLNTSLEGLQEREDLRGALSIAAEIQAGLQPVDLPIPANFALETFQQSCYSVGGDYYDIIEVDENRLWIIVADVTGKGYSAALTVSNLNAILHTLASAKKEFSQVPKIANSAMSNILTRGRFVTLFMAELNKDSGSFMWFNAGHTPAVLASKNSSKLLESTAPPLGVIEELMPAPTKEVFSSGDLLAVFTDGVTELRSSTDQKAMYGIERTKEWVGANSDAKSGTLTDEFLKELNRFGAPAADDDLTLLFLKCIKQTDKKD